MLPPDKNDEQSEEAAVRDLPYLTPELPGIGGELKTVPEDFFVEEIPAYSPSGEGEHLFLKIEKRDVSAEQLTNFLARELNIPSRDIGVAGLKDRRAVTQQWVSVPASCEDRISTLETEAIRVLESSRHRNKLKTGHLKANRFRIVLRNTHSNAMENAQRICEKIQDIGFPNYFGTQRFGTDNKTLETGLGLLNGEITTRQIPFRRRRFLLRLSLSAVQSWLFNEVLANRITAERANRVFAGDVMKVTQTGGIFIAEDVPEEQRRVDIGETAITGPMFGPKMKSTEHEPFEWESETLAAHQIQRDNFSRFPKLTSGTRRPLLVRPDNFSVESVPEGIQVNVDLPSGVYATVLLRELMKTD